MKESITVIFEIGRVRGSIIFDSESSLTGEIIDCWVADIKDELSEKEIKITEIKVLTSVL